MSPLQESIKTLRAVGQFSAMQTLENELAEEKRKQRALIQASPAVAEAFKRRRDAEEQEVLRKRRIASDQNKLEFNAGKVKAELAAAHQ